MTSMVVSMSAPRIGRSSTSSMSAPSSTPAMTATTSPRKKLSPSDSGDQIDGVGAESVELAVGEIHHPHDAEDQRQADAEQRVGAAQDQRVDEVLEELVHVLQTP